MKLQTKSVLALTILLAGTAAMAQAAAPTPDYTLSYNVGVVSNYVFRGITQTSNDPALQAGVDFAHKSGFYLGAWGSNVSWLKDFSAATEGTLEIDLYGGYKGAITKDLAFDIGVIGYIYPSNNTATNANTTEVYGALTYSIVTAKYSQSTGNFVANANSSNSKYFEVAANFDLGSGYTLTPHVGRQTVPNQTFTNGITGEVLTGNAADYTDYALTIAKDFGNGLVISAAATGTDSKEGGFYTDAKSKFIAKNAVLVGLKYSF